MCVCVGGWVGERWVTGHILFPSHKPEPFQMPPVPSGPSGARPLRSLPSRSRNRPGPPEIANRPGFAGARPDASASLSNLAAAEAAGRLVGIRAWRLSAADRGLCPPPLEARPKAGSQPAARRSRVCVRARNPGRTGCGPRMRVCATAAGRHLGALDASRDRVGLHPARRVHRVPQQRVPDVLQII